MTAQNYLSNQKFNKKTFGAKRAILILLSIFAITGVFWWLKLTGITLAGEAFCGIAEHSHTEECLAEGCDIAEHTHIATCYSNPTADVETKSEWESTLSEYKKTGILADDLVGIAKTQLGYNESTLNYIVGADGVTRGYTRYGAWYGNEYGDWSAMFLSFCLNYADIDSDLAPFNAGSETMRMLWENEGLYNGKKDYIPVSGDIAFIDNDGNGKADAVGIIVMTDFSNILTVQGDVNNTVDRVTYFADDEKILGYGVMNNVLRKTVDPEYLEYIDGVMGLIDELPTFEEFDEALFALEDDMDAYAEYYYSVRAKIDTADMFYRDIDANIAPLVLNYSKLRVLLESIPETYATVPQSGGYTIFQSNAFSYSGYSFTIWNGTAASIFNADWVQQYQLKSWTAYRIEYNEYSASHYVAQIYGKDVDKRNIKASNTNGFLVFVEPSKVTVDADIQVGDSVSTWQTKYSGGTPFYKYTKSAPGSASNANVPDPNGVGGVLFGTTAQSIERNNALTPIQNMPDTSDFIEINLFNYHANGTQNINTKFANDRTSSYPYPAFTRTNFGHGSDYDYPTDGFAFGDWIVAGVDFKEFLNSYDTGKTGGKRLGINAVVSAAKRPNQGYMMKTLIDGYPAIMGDASATLSKAKSLRYLFSDDEIYVTKMNKNNANISGLFKYNENTKLYSFDSRKNHAQYNSQTGNFDLYNEKITSNFIMYPFGNFLPFNSIISQSAFVGTSTQKVSNYFKEVAADSLSSYHKSGDDKYLGMSRVMDKVIAGMNTAYGEDVWTVKQIINEYATRDMKDSTFANLVQQNGTLANLYNIDFSRETDFFFGMDIHINFLQPNGGIIKHEDGEDSSMIFEFVGDDDVWVYLDGILFLDLSGIHSHVGGKIDFAKGEVYYYQLKDYTGEVESTPYVTTSFAAILKAAGKTDAEISKLLNENGTFKDYSTHKLDFYYMERGSGSSICSINFNIPVLEKNTIEIAKELDSNTDGLGSPDYLFQIVKQSDYSTLVSEGYPYSVYNANGELIAERTVEANGIIRIKAGQSAKLANISENSGQYFVRELLLPDVAAQCSKVVIQGGNTATETLAANFVDYTVGGITYKAVASGLGNANGSYKFIVKNSVAPSACLTVEKVQIEYTPDAPLKEFTFELLFDGAPIPVGTKYTLIYGDGVEEEKTITTAGEFKLFGTQKAKFDNIYAGSLIKLSEIGADEYVVTFEYSGGKSFALGNDSISGIATSGTAMNIKVTNDREGKKVTVEGDKIFLNPDGNEYSFIFDITEVEFDSENNTYTVKNGGLSLSETVIFGSDSQNGEKKSFDFFLNLPTSIYDVSKTYYFRISERNATSTNGIDTNFFILTVSFDADGNPVTTLKKNGTGEDLERFEFINMTVRKLKVTKTVEGVSSGNADFDFIINATFNGSPLNGEFESVGAVEKVVFENGRATVTLAHGEYFELIALPYGTEWTIFESEDGYYTEYRFDTETDRQSGNTAGSTLESDTIVHFYNIGGDELPSTGGFPREIFTIIGGFILLSALTAALIVRRNRKKNV